MKMFPAKARCEAGTWSSATWEAEAEAKGEALESRIERLLSTTETAQCTYLACQYRVRVAPFCASAPHTPPFHTCHLPLHRETVRNSTQKTSEPRRLCLQCLLLGLLLLSMWTLVCRVIGGKWHRCVALSSRGQVARQVLSSCGALCHVFQSTHSVRVAWPALVLPGPWNARAAVSSLSWARSWRWRVDAMWRLSSKAPATPGGRANGPPPPGPDSPALNTPQRGVLLVFFL